jgi:hypothetical protein
MKKLDKEVKETKRKVNKIIKTKKVEETEVELGGKSRLKR